MTFAYFFFKYMLTCVIFDRYYSNNNYYYYNIVIVIIVITDNVISQDYFPALNKRGCYLALQLASGHNYLYYGCFEPSCLLIKLNARTLYFTDNLSI